MSDGKRPNKGTLRLAPRADKPAAKPGKAAKVPSAKSGVRRVAAAAARGEKLLPAVPVREAREPKAGGSERRGRPGKAPTGEGHGERGPRAPRTPRMPEGGPGRTDSPRRKPAGEGRAAEPGDPWGSARPGAAGGRGERRDGRPAPASSTAWSPDRRDEARAAAKPRRSPSSPAEGGEDDVWAQARANLAARSRAAATPRPEKSPAPARKTVAEPVAGDAARPTPDHPLYDPHGVRVSKLLAEQGLCSRREADSYIERGWVLVDGQRVTELGLRVAPTARVSLAPEASAAQTQQVTILLHKPVGYVSGQPEPGYAPAASLIGPANQVREAAEPVFHPGMLRGLAPAGRLDIDSTGLLVLTQDGRVARQLIGDDSKVDKEYIVRVEGTLIDGGLALLNHGLSLDDQPLRPARVEWINDDQLRFVLREGRKRQIRRMCELVGLHVVGLKRVRIGQLRLGDLPLGCWRLLRPGETF